MKVAKDSSQAAVCLVRDGPAITGLTAGPFSEQNWRQLTSVGSDALAAMFDVKVQDGARDIRVPGHCVLDHARRLAVFIPTMPMLSSESYRITFGDPATELADRLRLEPDFASCKEAPRVLALYPSGANWPANTLRFYIEFSIAMAEDQLLERILLYDADGIEQKSVFLDTARELWSADRRRLTVLFDPGRVKSGLRAHVALGRALRSGCCYRIEIDAGFCSVSGVSIGTAYVRHFRVDEPLERIVAPHEWRWNIPQPNCREPLRLAFPYPLDQAMLACSLEVLDNDRRRVSGEVVVDDSELSWSFTPHADWRTQPYQLRVATTLEDPAGNNLNEPFERFPAPSKRVTASIDLPFRPVRRHMHDAIFST